MEGTVYRRRHRQVEALYAEQYAELHCHEAWYVVPEYTS